VILVAKGNKINAPHLASFFPSFPTITTIHHHHTPLFLNKVRQTKPSHHKTQCPYPNNTCISKITWRKWARIKNFICEKTIITMLTKHWQITSFLLHQNNQLLQNNGPTLCQNIQHQTKAFSNKTPNSFFKAPFFPLEHLTFKSCALEIQGDEM